MLILPCLALAVVTNSLKGASILLHFYKKGSSDNIVNNGQRGSAVSTLPGIAGRLTVLLARLKTSVAIWFFLLVVYNIIRRWMPIQRRHITFDCAKQRRVNILAPRTRGEEETPHIPNNIEGSMDIDNSEINLDAIKAQLLHAIGALNPDNNCFGVGYCVVVRDSLGIYLPGKYLPIRRYLDS